MIEKRAGARRARKKGAGFKTHAFSRSGSNDPSSVIRRSDGPTWDRTRDRPVMSRWLYQLSYGPMFFDAYRSIGRPRVCQASR